VPVQIIQRGKFKSLDKQQRKWLERRQAIEPTIGHAKSDHRMDRCWLLRAIAAKGLKGFLSALSQGRGAMAAMARLGVADLIKRSRAIELRARIARTSRAGGVAQRAAMNFAGPTTDVQKPAMD
jgi:transposase, IS5 family